MLSSNRKWQLTRNAVAKNEKLTKKRSVRPVSKRSVRLKRLKRQESRRRPKNRRTISHFCVTSSCS